MSMIKNGDEVIVLRHTIKDEVFEVNNDWTKTFAPEDKLISIAFENKGGCPITLNNGKTLAVGDPMLSFKGEIGVYRKMAWNLQFNGTTTPSCVIYQTFETGSFLENIKIATTVK